MRQEKEYKINFEESFAGNDSCFALNNFNPQETPMPISECEIKKKPLLTLEEKRKSLDEKNKRIIESVFEQQRGKRWTEEQRDTQFDTMVQFGESCKREVLETKAFLIQRDREAAIKRIKKPLPPMNFLKKKETEEEKVMTSFREIKAKRSLGIKDLCEFFQALSFLGKMFMQKVNEIWILCKKDKEKMIEILSAPLPKMKFLTKKKICLYSPLPNLGNTCFANALIQCLYHIELFRDEIIKTPENDVASKIGIFKWEIY